MKGWTAKSWGVKLGLSAPYNRKKKDLKGGTHPAHNNHPNKTVYIVRLSGQVHGGEG